MRLAILLAGALAIAGTEADADIIGWSLATSNDSIGEAKDRWQSSSIQAALIFGDPWQGQLPEAIGEVLELRFRSDVLTPEDLDSPDPDDRRHAGVLAVGLHTHFAREAVEVRLGADYVVVGEQTGLLSLQRDIHRALDFVIPELDDFQIENQESLDISGEVARAFRLGSASARPFLEAQVGTEDFIRVGADLVWGNTANGVLKLRALATGQRVVSMRGPDGFGFMVGGDMAHVEESIYLPSDLGYELTPVRQRLRAGARLIRGPVDVFYGLAWLGREFEAQPEGQLVGTFQFRVTF